MQLALTRRKTPQFLDTTDKIEARVKLRKIWLLGSAWFRFQDLAFFDSDLSPFFPRF
jgi:hypothetical protein